MVAIIIARMIWGLDVSPQIKKEISHCTFYNKVPTYERFEVCKKGLNKETKNVRN